MNFQTLGVLLTPAFWVGAFYTIYVLLGKVECISRADQIGFSIVLVVILSVVLGFIAEIGSPHKWRI